MRLLCRELSRRPDVDVLLATAGRGQLARVARQAGVPVHGLWWRMAVDPRALAGIARLIRNFRPDVIHAHDSHSLFAALFCRSLPNLPWSWKAASDAPVIGSRRVDFHVKRISNWHRAARVIAVSDGVKRVLVQDGVNERDVVVIPDGIDPDEVRANALRAPDIRRRLGLPDHAPLAVNVAALVDHKDQRTLIRAAAYARDRAPRLHWVIAGAGPLREALQQEIANLGVGDIVHLVGYVDLVDALIREARVFVMSSTEEGMGSVVLQALALERPVVATRAGGLPEIVPAEWLVPIGDAAALAAKTVRALDHPAPRPLDRRFTAKAMAEATLAQYHLLA